MLDKMYKETQEEISTLKFEEAKLNKTWKLLPSPRCQYQRGGKTCFGIHQGFPQGSASEAYMKIPQPT